MQILEQIDDELFSLCKPIDATRMPQNSVPSTQIFFLFLIPTMHSNGFLKKPSLVSSVFW